jgi:homoserine dehydrogenase
VSQDWAANKKPLDWAGMEVALTDSAMPNVMFVDCTASGAVGEMYEGWLRNGHHVITPNKKAGSGPIDYYKRIRQISRDSYTHFFSEATVGAGLPILNTVQMLAMSGEKITKIEGILSGTLSYIFNNYDGKMPFSEVVKQAKEVRTAPCEHQRCSTVPHLTLPALPPVSLSWATQSRSQHQRCSTVPHLTLPPLPLSAGLYGAGANTSAARCASLDSLPPLPPSPPSRLSQLGYTEPDPRDDLSGTDVARKVVILARESGLDISMEDVPVDSLVPEALRDCSIDEFMAKLPDYDEQMGSRLAEAAARGEVLRFVGVVDHLTKKGASCKRELRAGLRGGRG